MKRTKEIQGNGMYIFYGRSNANSCFIEKIIHAKKFLVYANYFLGGYLSILDYVITKDGWTLLVKIKGRKIIVKNEEEEVWRIISERIRLFLSTFVRVTNRQKGRTGCLVHSGYERYYFESKSEAIMFIEKIRKSEVQHYSRKKKYRGLKTHYRISVNKSKGSVFICSRDIRRKRFEMGDVVGVIDFIELTELVVEKFVNSTLKKHIPQNTPLILRI